MSDLLPDDTVQPAVEVAEQPIAVVQDTPPEANAELSETDALVAHIMGAVPSGKKSFITKDFVEQLCKVSEDETEREALINNFVDYATILEDGSYSMKLYMEVVTFATFYTWTGDRKIAYAKTFPARYEEMSIKGKSDNHISSIISTFMSGKLAKKILGQIHTPIKILFRSELYKSVLKLAELRDKQGVSDRIAMECSGKLADILNMSDVVDDGFLQQADVNQISELTAVLNKVTELNKIQADIIRQRGATASEVVSNKLNLKQDENGNYVQDDGSPMAEAEVT